MADYKDITEEEARSYLSFYVPDPDRLDAYIARLQSAPNLKAVDRIFVTMVRAEGIPTDILTRQEFYMTVRVFFAHLKAARATLHEHFVDIQRAARSRSSAGGERALLKPALSGGIEVAVPKPGEKVRYSIELVITVSRDYSDRLQLDTDRVEVKEHPVDLGGSTCACYYMPEFEEHKFQGTSSRLSGLLKKIASYGVKDNFIEIEYRSPLTHRKHLTVGQALDLLKLEPQ